MAWHCRSCSGDLTAKLYHHGDTADIGEVVQHVYAQGYTEIVLIGFSMGANITLKYLSVCANKIPAIEEARYHRYFHFEMPPVGGHCGFMLPGQNRSWAEVRALQWCSGS